MNSRLVALAMALGACTAAHASTALSVQNLNGVLVNAGEYISPYSGTLAGAAVTLFSADFSDNMPVPSNYNVNVSAPDGDLSTTRFATANYNTAFPSGTRLYEEVAWLFTQLMAPGDSTANQIGIQEAVWHMTSTSSSLPATSLSNTGSNLTYLQWMAAAASDYSTAVNGFTTPDYSAWMILTDVANQSVKTQGIGNQELLAYYAPGSVGIVTTFTAIPEPGAVSMLAIGLGLLLAGMKLRARSGTRAEAGQVLRG